MIDNIIEIIEQFQLSSNLCQIKNKINKLFSLDFYKSIQLFLLELEKTNFWSMVNVSNRKLHFEYGNLLYSLEVCKYLLILYKNYGKYLSKTTITLDSLIFLGLFHNFYKYNSEIKIHSESRINYSFSNLSIYEIDRRIEYYKEILPKELKGILRVIKISSIESFISDYRLIETKELYTIILFLSVAQSLAESNPGIYYKR